MLLLLEQTRKVSELASFHSLCLDVAATSSDDAQSSYTKRRQLSFLFFKTWCRKSSRALWAVPKETERQRETN